eukprot:4563475-Amphidinium_carterae.2
MQHTPAIELLGATVTSEESAWAGYMPGLFSSMTRRFAWGRDSSCPTRGGWQIRTVCRPSLHASLAMTPLAPLKIASAPTRPTILTGVFAGTGDTGALA